jgi:hypothetical protein
MHSWRSRIGIRPRLAQLRYFPLAIFAIIFFVDILLRSGSSTLHRRIALVLSLTAWRSALGFIAMLFLLAEWIVFLILGCLYVSIWFRR